MGNHEEISDDDIIFIGNSSNKTYHKIIADREHKKGDIIHWSGVYTWFKSPVSDDDDLLCYEGVIDNKKVFLLDCKKNGRQDNTVACQIYKEVFYDYERKMLNHKQLPGNKVTAKGLRIVSDGSGSCVITFD